MFKYVVHYADGRGGEVPVVSEIDIDHYRAEEAEGHARCAVGLDRPSFESDVSAVAYAKQWNNPRPEVEIKSVDMVYGARASRRARCLMP